ncbi:TonB family protein [Phenylobacterium terrae]|uniref:TonB family protein n=1 Tax=Phenylobacterium terrae TaxID=2665495 RepID=A0ABW4MZP4_9CAUL
MRTFLFLVSAGLVAASAAAAQPRVITNPDWAAKPNAELMADAFPTAAQKLLIQGAATVSCVVSAMGLLEKCSVVSEAPAGLGFGAGALRLTEHFRMKPKTVNGEPVAGGTVRIPIRFTLPPPDAPPAKPTPVSAARLEAARSMMGPAEEHTAMWVKWGEAEAAAMASQQLDPGVLAAAKQAFTNAAQRFAPQWTEAQIAELAASYEEPELRGLAKFAKTSAGRAWLELDGLPLVSWGEITQEYISQISRRARTDYCSRYLCAIDMLEIDPGKSDAQIVDPAWTQLPSFEHLALEQPKLALILQIGGYVRLQCRIDATGTPQSCVVRGETPPGLGFGAAAMELAPYFKIDQALLSQGAARETVSFVIPFPAQPPAPSPRATPATLPDGIPLAFEVAELALAGRGLETWIVQQATTLLDADVTRTGPSQRAAALDAVRAAARAEWPQVVSRVAQAYAAKLSAADLQQVRDFLRSPEARIEGGLDATRRREQITGYYSDLIRMEAGRLFCESHACTPTQPAPRSGETRPPA